MHDAYQEHLLDESTVCSSCFRTIRVERIDPYRSNDLEAAATLSRKKQTTEIGYGPAESVTEQKGTFCDYCGTESAFDRTWDSVDFHDPAGPYGRERFKQLIKNAMWVLGEKASGFDPHTFAEYALARYDDGHGIDHCLSEATEHAIVTPGDGQNDQRVIAD